MVKLVGLCVQPVAIILVVMFDAFGSSSAHKTLQRQRSSKGFGSEPRHFVEGNL